MKLLAFSDLHLRPESEGVCFHVLAQIRVEAIERGIECVAFLGDFFHLRYQVPVHLLNRLYEELVRWAEAGLRLVFLPGNHDQVDELGRNALEVFQAFDHVSVFTQPTMHLGAAWIPYRKDLGQVKEALDWARQHGAQVVFGHLPVLGAFQNNTMKDMNGCPLAWFKGFSKVILGHYHKRQQWGGVYYVGSPWQTRADEAGQEKGYALVDLAQKSLEYVTRQWGREHHKVDLSDKPIQNFLAEMPWDGIHPGDAVRVVVHSEADVEKVKKHLTKAGFTDAVVQPKAVVVSGRSGLDKGASLSEYAKAFAEDRGGQFDQAALLQVFEEILGRVGS